MAITEQTLQDIRDHGADIIEASARTHNLTMRRVGTAWVTLCPFHTEKTASLNIKDGYFHCFGCGEHGDAIAFIQQLDSVGFTTAVSIAASHAHIEVRTSQGAAPQDPLKGLLAEVASRFNQHLLNNPEPLSYLTGRAVSTQDIERFRVGYCPTNIQAWTEGLDLNELSRAGIVQDPRNKPRTQFAGRIMFPWSDHTGRVRGFGARRFRPSDTFGGKYVNSSASDIFSKGSLLYGLHQARHAMKRTGQAVVVEGYLDVISPYRNGIKNAVATGGTAITSQQIRLLGKFCDEAVLLTDGDTAGLNAALKAAKTPWESISLKIGVLPQGHDPDSFAIQNPAAFAKVIHNAALAVDVVLDHVTTWDLDDPTTLKDATKLLSDVITTTVPDLAKHKTRLRAARRLGVRPTDITAASVQPTTPKIMNRPSSPLEYNVLRSLLSYPADVTPWIEPEWIQDLPTQEAFKAIWSGDYPSIPRAIAAIAEEPARVLTRAFTDITVPISQPGAIRTMGLWLAQTTALSAGTDPWLRQAQLKARTGDTGSMNTLYQHLTALHRNRLITSGGPTKA